ncbi:TonB-dependent receptor [Alcaligenaceae bacterium SJ-26]|nr:TonB-dependent receptor [Alcaligenaceae bacterium SJ-26]
MPVSSLPHFRLRLGFMAVAATLACVAQAQPQIQSVSSVQIDAQPLGQALNALALQTGARIVFASDLTEHKQAGALRGDYTVQQAVTQLLAGSGLVADFSGNEVVIRPAGNAARASDEVTALSQVVVTASRNERYLSELPMSVSAISAQELERNPQTSVVAQLQQTPGVLASGTNEAGSQKISIRGNSYTRTLVLIDGVRASDFRGLGGVGSIGQTVNPADIERIEVIKGPSSVLYGSDAIGGVVNIITKSGLRADRPLQGAVSMLYDSSSRSFEPNVSLSGAARGFSYRLSGNGLNAQDRRTPDMTLPYSQYRQRNYNGRLDYTWDDGRVEFAVDRHTGSFDATPTWFNAANGTNYPLDADDYTAATGRYYVPKNDRTTYRTKLELTNLGEYLSGLTVSLYHQDLTTRSATDFVWSGVPQTQFEFKHKAYGGSVQSNWQLGDAHFVTLGLDADHTEYKGVDDFFTAGVQTSSDRTSGTERSIALFVQDEWSLTDNTVLTAGLRNTWTRVELDRSDRYPDRTNSSSTSRPVASLGVVYSGIENTQLRALFSQGFRNPNMYISYMGSSNGNRHVLPNPDLKAEKSNNYEIGARYNNGNLDADLSLFYSDIRDGIRMVTLRRGPGGVEMQNQNDDKTRSYGAELAVSYAIDGTGFTPYANLSLLRYKTIKRGFSTTDNGVPSAWGTLGLKWETNLQDGSNLFADGQLVTSRGAHSEIVNDLTGVASGSEYRSGWSVANLTVGLQKKTSTLTYNATLSLRNLFDRSYTPAPGGYLPEPGRHVVATVGIEF